MAKYVHINVGRKFGMEIIRFLGAFAFGEYFGNLLQSVDAKLPVEAISFLRGATVPINDSLTAFLEPLLKNDKEAEKNIFFNKLREANISEANIKELYEGSWPKAKKLLDNTNAHIDAKGLAKKLDCSEIQANAILGAYNTPTKIALVIEGTNIIGIGLAGLTTYYFPHNAIIAISKLNNPFVERLIYAGIGQVVSRITQEILPPITSKIGLWANSDKSSTPNEKSPLLDSEVIAVNDSEITTETTSSPQVV